MIPISDKNNDYSANFNRFGPKSYISDKSHPARTRKPSILGLIRRNSCPPVEVFLRNGQLHCGLFSGPKSSIIILSPHHTCSSWWVNAYSFGLVHRDPCPPGTACLRNDHLHCKNVPSKINNLSPKPGWSYKRVLACSLDLMHCDPCPLSRHEGVPPKRSPPLQYFSSFFLFNYYGGR